MTQAEERKKERNVSVAALKPDLLRCQGTVDHVALLASLDVNR